MMCDMEPADIKKGKEFVVEIIRRGPAGQMARARLGLPANWGELEDALAQARVTGDKMAYAVDIQEARTRQLLDHMPEAEHANLYEMNYLAQRLSLLDKDAYRLYKGMVYLEKLYGPTAEIPVSRLIDMADPENRAQFLILPVNSDKELGMYACEHGYLSEMIAMPRAKNGYFDYERMGRELRLRERGVFFADGDYLRLAGEISQKYSPDCIPRPEKPNWVFSMDVAIPQYATVRLELPDHTDHFEKVAQMVRERGCAVPRFESILPALSGQFGCDDDLHELNDLADAIRALNDRGELSKYRALVQTYIYPDLPDDLVVVSWDVVEATELAQRVDEYELQTEITLPEEIAADCLREHYSISEEDPLYAYIDLKSFGESIRGMSNNCFESAYGLVYRKDGGELWPSSSQEISQS